MCKIAKDYISKWTNPTTSEKKKFSYKNICVYTLNYLAYLINKNFIHQSNLGKFGKVRKSSAVRYCILPQCCAVRYKDLVLAKRQRFFPSKTVPKI